MRVEVDHDALFATKFKAPMSTRPIQYRVKKYLNEAGIKGDEINEKAAYSLIRKAFHEDASICVVLDENDLVSLADGQVSFWPVLLERVERVRFGRPK